MWTLMGAVPTETITRLLDGITIHIVQTLGLLEVVHEVHPSVHIELGRLTVSSVGAKLEAVDRVLIIQSGGADPRTVPYELQPRGDCSEVVFLRHGDSISSPETTGGLTCSWQDSEVQVNSSAAQASNLKNPVNGDNGVAETPEEEDETEDEDLDQTTTAVEATQSKSQQQPHATPQLSNQRSIVVQETPTAARTDVLYTLAMPMDVDQPNVSGATPDLRGLEQESEPEPKAYSTVRTRHSQNGLNDGASALPGPSPGDVDDTDDETSQPRHPKVMISKKRLSPATEGPELEPRKRTKTMGASDNDTQDSRLSNIAVFTSPVAAASASKGRKRTSVVKDLKPEHTPSRSQRSQRSTSATSEPYQGDTPHVATSNSTITEKSQAAKFLKKQGGSLIDSVKGSFNILCVRDGDLHKTPKVLQAIANGTPIVTDKWLIDSAKAGHFLSVDAYQPSAPNKEKEWQFVLKDVLGQPQTPFEGYTIHFTTSLHSAYKTFTEIEQVCKAAGAVKVTKKKMDKSKSGRVIILADELGDKEAEKLMQEGFVCYSKDILPTSIFRGFLDLGSDEFKINLNSVDAGPAKKTRGKKS